MTRRLLMATNNPGKLREFRELLGGCGWEILAPVDLGLALDVEETGTSYATNASLKAEAFGTASGCFVLADDSGLEVDALDGAPGVYSARYGGPGLDDAGRVNRLLEALAGIPDSERTARFRAVLVLRSPDGRSWQSEGICAGTIARVPRGESGFGYDPIFLLPNLGRSMAELSAEEKNLLSHRARAAIELRPILKALAAESLPSDLPPAVDTREVQQTTEPSTIDLPLSPNHGGERAGEREGRPQLSPESSVLSPRPAGEREGPADALTHIDAQGRARMVDVGDKDVTAREAVARGQISMQPATLALILAGEIAKGNVLTTAQVAGIMAAKRTHELIPMCHPLLLTGIDVDLEPSDLDSAESRIEITARVRTTGKTGVEMEALTAVSVAALTVYDMCKAVDRGMRIGEIRLARKSGGRSGTIVLE